MQQRYGTHRADQEHQAKHQRDGWMDGWMKKPSENFGQEQGQIEEILCVL